MRCRVGVREKLSDGVDRKVLKWVGHLESKSREQLEKKWECKSLSLKGKSDEVVRQPIKAFKDSSLEMRGEGRPYERSIWRCECIKCG